LGLRRTVIEDVFVDDGRLVVAARPQIRMITRRAFGFHSPTALIALAILSLADLCPPLPR